MEQERLARLAARKRKASISPPPLQREEHKEEKKPKRVDTMNPSSNVTTAISHSSGKSTQPTETLTLQFPNGVIQKTWVKGQPRTGNDIKIEEILRKDELRTAFFSSFMWDPEWIFHKINTRKTNIILCMQAKTDIERQQHREDAQIQGFTNIRLVFPPLNGAYTCMHSKLMLLFYPGFLRIVVPTANLTEYDWGETGVMENSVFLLDLPRMSEKGAEEDVTLFGQELLYFLDRMQAPQNLRDGLLKFDFSSTRHLAFIHNVFGPHFGKDIERTGFPGLSKAVQHLELQTDPDTLQLDIASSSIGSLTASTIANLYEAARGAHVIKEPKAAKSRPTTNTVPALQNVRVHFPTEDTVVKSLGGPNNAGTIALPEKYFNKPDFPRSIFRDYESKRVGILSHNKLIFARGTRSKEVANNRAIAWVYIGSSNLSESAWGGLVIDRSRKELKLTCRNWECGVLMAVPDASSVDDLEKTFDSVVDIPFRHPGQAYGARKPWNFRG